MTSGIRSYALPRISVEGGNFLELTVRMSFRLNIWASCIFGFPHSPPEIEVEIEIEEKLRDHRASVSFLQLPACERPPTDKLDTKIRSASSNLEILYGARSEHRFCGKAWRMPRCSDIESKLDARDFISKPTRRIRRIPDTKEQQIEREHESWLMLMLTHRKPAGLSQAPHMI